VTESSSPSQDNDAEMYGTLPGLIPVVRLLEQKQQTQPDFVLLCRRLATLLMKRMTMRTSTISASVTAIIENQAAGKDANKSETQLLLPGGSGGLAPRVHGAAQVAMDHGEADVRALNTSTYGTSVVGRALHEFKLGLRLWLQELLPLKVVTVMGAWRCCSPDAR
jgi:hypothetical protein